MEEKNTPQDASPGTSNFDGNNIFEELTQNSEIQREVSAKEQQEKRNIFFYLRHANSFFLTFNTLCLISILLFFGYYYIQSSESSRNYSFLSPVCSFFISSYNTDSNCYGVTYLLGKQQNVLKNLQEKQAGQILPIFADLYSFENFHVSKKMNFLLNSSTDRLRPTKILEAFDELKNIYSSVDKSEIQCFDIKIRQEDMISLRCDVFSSDWDTKIVTFKEGIKTFQQGGGTSISRAASFIDFIKNFESSPFHVVQQNTGFDTVSVQVPPYTQKTTIDLVLQYNTFNIQN